MFFALEKKQEVRRLFATPNMGRGVMAKCMITITEILEKAPCPTVILDVSDGTISVNCPKNTGIEIESISRSSYCELIFKLPHTAETLRFICENCHTSHTHSEVQLDATFGFSTELDLTQKSHMALEQ